MKTRSIPFAIFVMLLTAIQLDSHGGAVAKFQNSNITLIGSCWTGEGSASDVFVSGNYAYMATRGGGLNILDVSQPAHPRQLSFCKLSEKANSIYVDGHYAYVTTDGAFQEFHGHGLHIIDVRSPASPQQVGIYEIIGGASAVHVSEGKAYVVEYREDLHIIDISNPQSPQKIAELDTRDIIDVWVKGNYAYMIDNGGDMSIIDISDSQSPRYLNLSHASWSGWGSGFCVSGNYAYIAAGCEGMCRCWGGLETINLRDPRAGQHESLLEFGCDPAWDVYVSGQYAYVVTSSGLRLIDISAPDIPQQVGFFETASNYGGCVFVSNDLVYVQAGGGWFYILQNDLLTKVWDITDKYPKDVKLAQNYPNPFNPSTAIEYELRQSAHVRITICDERGRHIKTLANQQQGTGHFQTSWDGTDEHGIPATGGIYFCRMQAGEYTDVVKILLLK